MYRSEVAATCFLNLTVVGYTHHHAQLPVSQRLTPLDFNLVPVLLLLATTDQHINFIIFVQNVYEVP